LGIRESPSIITSEKGIIETLETEYELFRLMGIESVTISEFKFWARVTDLNNSIKNKITLNLKSQFSGEPAV
jgi:hypothetical protein